MKKRVLNKCFAILLVFTMVAHFVGTNFYFHTHIIDGTEITHSHPYSSDNNGMPLHSHSATSCALIEMTTNLTYLTVATFIFLFLAKKSKAFYNVASSLLSKFDFVVHKQLRAPPVL